MSMASFIDDETLQEYISESLEHLADIEQDLLTIEEGGEEIDEEVVNRVFRAAHSLKGGAGFLALETIKELAHKIENVLDLMRNREMVPNPEIINILLKAFDKLRDLINNSSTSNEENIDEFVTSLVGLTTAHLEPAAQCSVSNTIPIIKTDGSVIFEVPQIDLDQAKKNSQNLYLLEYDLIHDVYQHGKTPMEVIKNVMDLGTIIETLIDINKVGTLDDIPINSIPFYMLISSIIEPVVAPNFLNIPENQLHLIGNDGKQIGDSSPAEAPAPEKNTPPAPQEPTPVAAPEPPAATPAQKPDKPVSDKTKTAPKKPKTSDAPTSLRVNVDLLENLMTLAGEMVLSRNQLMQAVNEFDQHSIKLAGQRIDLVTSELQEAIMMTRMQPIGSVFNKFPRIVRDMSQKLNKEINLVITGKNVELDKTIVEGLNDPLTHLIRNSADHGIELPDARAAKDKPRAGRIDLKAYHEAGQVNIEITDDGGGLDSEKIANKALEKGMITAEQHATMSRKEKMALILLPSLSTADKITDVSGRGVGMDVVKSNIDLLGGQIEIDSKPGEGTTIRIKLPLTLAIIPSLLVSIGDERFALPQVNVSELVRIGAAQIKDRIERVGDSEVMPLRGELIPLIRLNSVLNIPKTIIDPKTGNETEDRRQLIADRRSPETEIDQSLVSEAEEIEQKRSGEERRYKATSDLNIVVVSAGSFKYGLVVDELHDSVEIVVKPLGRHLKHLTSYAGATIMGDGRVALILDVGGVARLADLTSMAGSQRAQDLQESAETNRNKDNQALLLFNNGPKEPCAVPLDIVERVEQVNFEDIETKSGQKVIKYRGGSLPLFSLSDVANVTELSREQELIVIVFTVADREIGLMASEPVDTVEIKAVIDHETLKDTGIMGSAIINEETTLIIDIHELVETLKPEWFKRLQKREEHKKEVQRQMAVSGDNFVPPEIKKILLVEDSDFFRSQLKKYIDDDDRECIQAEDGLIAWNWLQEHPDELSLIITDIEMPNMDGFELCQNIRSDHRFDNLKIIAVTSLAADEHIAKGKKIGIDDYQIKLDKEKLLASIEANIS